MDIINAPLILKKGDCMNKKSTDKETDIIFTLERQFPVIDNIFSSYPHLSSKDANNIIILDTNVLLLPYVADQLGKKDIKVIEDLLIRLKDENRIFIPERVAREFIKNRDGKISDLIKALNDKKSRISPPELGLSKALQDMNQYNTLESLSKNINELTAEYKKTYTAMINDIKSWKGNDPITMIYRRVFDKSNILPYPGEEQDAIKEWEYRRLMKCPPGYKDGGKDDTGIGDYLIWKTLIQTGKEQNKNVIFVTGDQKSDWFIRGEKEPIFIRPELIDEFRRESGNLTLRLIKFDELLTEYNISEEIVKEVKRAESNDNKKSNANSKKIYSKYSSVRKDGFDYSTNNGEILLTENGISFKVKFSKASDESIYVYNSSGSYQIARVKNSTPNDILIFDDYDSTSDHYNIRKGEVFLYKNDNHDILAVRILEIKDDSRKDENDFVTFEYIIAPRGSFVFAP